MKIQLEVDIFDDLEFCCDDMETAGFNWCGWLEGSDCFLFNQNVKDHYGPDGSFKLLKSDKCKKAYQEAKK